MGVSREAVIWGYRFFLGRDPESEAVIVRHMSLRDEPLLAEVLMTSPEFRARQPFGKHLALKANVARPGVVVDKACASSTRILVVGNCQSRGIANLIQAMTADLTATHIELTAAVERRMRAGDSDIGQRIAESDMVFVHYGNSTVEHLAGAGRAKIRWMPPIAFSAFHPDLVYIRNRNSENFGGGPMGEYHSSLAFYGWVNGLGVAETVRLFSEDVFEALGFFDYSRTSEERLLRLGRDAALPLDSMLGNWSRQGCWMHSINHPKLFVLADVTRALLTREGFNPLPDVEQYLQDDLADHPVWPVYPEIGRHLGVNGHYLFKRGRHVSERPVTMIGLEEFVHESYRAFSKHEKAELVCDRLESSRYQELRTFLTSRRGQARVEQRGSSTVPPKGQETKGANPYRGLPDYQFWRRAVERVAMHDIDPAMGRKFSLTRQQRIATAGSCFAQHIARTLKKSGFNYYVVEAGKGLSSEAALERHFGVFSARYGNIYTARQLLQLFDRAYGKFKPVDSYWQAEDGNYVDPFRPQIEPTGFSSPDALESSRNEHLASVREMFENLDIFIFTLGLTEGWRSRRDGAVYPLAPGVIAGTMDSAIHEFVNFGVSEVVADIRFFIERLHEVNPKAKLILTVSPVPLIATYEHRHVLVSNTYSKSALRVAAEEVCRNNPDCDYFPSYEIIVGSHAKGEYFEDDLRSVKQSGVDHVMRVFLGQYTMHGGEVALDPEFSAEYDQVSKIICDEESIESTCK